MLSGTLPWAGPSRPVDCRCNALELQAHSLGVHACGTSRSLCLRVVAGEEVGTSARSNYLSNRGRRLRHFPVAARVVSSGVSRKSAFVTVSVGVCLVSLPTLPLLLLAPTPLLALQAWLSFEPPLPHFLALTVGFLMAWLWWSMMVTWWRNWAESRGMSPEEVQYRGQGASILWPSGHLCERTEWANIWRPRSTYRDDASQPLAQAEAHGGPGVTPSVPPQLKRQGARNSPRRTPGIFRKRQVGP